MLRFKWMGSLIRSDSGFNFKDWHDKLQWTMFSSFGTSVRNCRISFSFSFDAHIQRSKFFYFLLLVKCRRWTWRRVKRLEKIPNVFSDQASSSLVNLFVYCMEKDWERLLLDEVEYSTENKLNIWFNIKLIFEQCMVYLENM